jgi:hypothetical protein
MNKRTKIIASTLGLACLALTGCVSEPGPYGTYYGGYYSAYERDHYGSDRYWRYRRDRDHDHHDRGPRYDHNDRGDRGRPSYNQAARERDKPDPTWAGRGSRGRDNGPDRDGGRSGGRGGSNILIPNQ